MRKGYGSSPSCAGHRSCRMFLVDRTRAVCVAFVAFPLSGGVACTALSARRAGRRTNAGLPRISSDLKLPMRSARGPLGAFFCVQTLTQPTVTQQLRGELSADQLIRIVDDEDRSRKHQLGRSGCDLDLLETSLASIGIRTSRSGFRPATDEDCDECPFLLDHHWPS
jgi:hypothetical protein